MKLIIKKDKMMDRIIFSLMAIAVIVLYPSMYYCMNSINVFVFASIIVCVCFIYVVIKDRVKFQSKVFSFLVVYIMISISYWILRGQNSLNAPYYLLFSFVTLFVFNISLIIKDERRIFIAAYVKVVLIIAVISLFFWFFGSTLNLISNHVSIVFKWGDKYRTVNSYYNIYFEAQGYNREFLGLYIGKKNCAIFAEAPMAAFVFALGLIFNICISKISPKVVNTILVITILSTFSTTGVLVLLLISVQFIVGKDCKTRIGKVTKLFLGIVTILGVGVLGYTLMAEKLSTLSGVTRIGKIMEELAVFSQNPLIGEGMGKYSFGSSNSFFALLADGGIVLWGIYYAPMLYLFYMALVKKKKFDWFILVYFCVFAVTVVQYYLISIFMTTFFWAEVLLIERKTKVNDFDHSTHLQSRTVYK